jgi:hypothetical protein
MKLLAKLICVLMSSILFASTILLTSCAGRDPRPVQVSQIGDRDKSCSTLETEMEFLDKDILERFPDASKTGSNTGLGVAGLFLIVPWFFMDFSEADEIEVSALIERHNHLLITAQDKSSEVVTTTFKVGSDFDVSGTYISEITSTSSKTLPRWFRNLEITLDQSGNKITGSDKSGKVELHGILKDNTIDFYMLPNEIIGNNDSAGNWKFSIDGKSAGGTWEVKGGRKTSGNWNLTRIE